MSTTYELHRTDTGTDLPAYQTGEQPVQEVRAALAEIDTDALQADLDRRKITILERHNEQLAAELAAYKRQYADPLGTGYGWTPGPKAMPRKHWTQVHGVADLTEQQRNSALVAPTLDELRDGDQHYAGAPIAAELVSGVDAKPGWPTWLGDLHHADAELDRVLGELRAWPEQYAARPVERTTVEPVEISDGYAETRLKAKLMHAGLKATDPDEIEWAELPAAPEQPALPTSPEGQAFLERGPAPDESMAGQVQQLDADAERRRKALAQAAHGERRELQPATEDPPRTGWKRPTWLTRAFDAVFPLKPREPRKDGGT